jgi:hypothetical protein
MSFLRRSKKRSLCPLMTAFLNYSEWNMILYINNAAGFVNQIGLFSYKKMRRGWGWGLGLGLGLGLGFRV